MSDLHQFNPGRKSWKMYTKELTSISGDDLTITPYEGEHLILEVSGNGNILFKEYGITYNLANLSNNTSSNVNLTNYDDASFGNVDICGNLNINNGLAINNSFGSDGEVLTSKGSTLPPIWAAPSSGGISAYHSVSCAQAVTTNTQHILSFSNVITPVNITSTSAIPFKIPTGGAGVYKISFGLRLATQYNCYYFIAKFLLNGSGSDLRVWGHIGSSTDINYIGASKTIMLSLSAGDEITIAVAAYGGAGAFWPVGMADIIKIG